MSAKDLIVERRDMYVPIVVGAHPRRRALSNEERLAEVGEAEKCARDWITVSHR